MSLNRAEQTITSHELHANLALCGLSAEAVASDLGWSTDRLEHTLAVDGPSDPVDVWELRDYLEQTVEAYGHESIPFTVLTSSARTKARMWFSLRRPPRHSVTA